MEAVTCDVPALTRCALHGMAQPHHSTLQGLAVRQAQRLPGAGTVTLRAIVIDNALNAGNAIYRGKDQCAELIDQHMLEECTVDRAAAFKQELFGTETRSQLLHCPSQVIAFCAREDIRNAVFAKFGEISIGNLLTEYGNDVVATDIVLAVVDTARWVDSDGELAVLVFGNMRFSRHLLRFDNASLGSLGQFSHGLAADDPSIGFEAFMHSFVVSAQNIPRNVAGRPREATRMEASVN